MLYEVITDIVQSQANNVVRTMYSMPPDHGAAVVAMILNDNELRADWIGELTGMRERLRVRAEEVIGNLERPIRELLWWRSLVENPRHSMVERSAILKCSAASSTCSGSSVITSYSIHYTKLYEVFVPTGHDLTFAEMAPAAKHAISHRADAFAKFVDGCLA